jgi:predicted ester cyclase
MLAQETSLQEANKAILHTVVDAYNQGDIEKACSYTHPACTLDGKPFGREGDLMRSNMFKTAWPDQVWTWDALIAEGDWVAARYTFKGTFTGPMREIPPNGQEIVFTGVSVYRFQLGQIVEIWEYYDKLGLYQQMGLIPAMG